MKKILTITILLILTVGLFVSCNANAVEELFKTKETPIGTVTYTVTFDMQGHGTQIATMTDIVSGSKISEPTDPTATDYVFGGWYKEKECTSKWNFSSDTVTKDITLYAEWMLLSECTFKAVYDTNNEANLTFYYDNKNHSGENITVYDNLPTAATTYNDWGNDYNKIRASVKGVVIDKSVKDYAGLTSTAYMFYGMTEARSISGAEYLDVSSVTDMSYMFAQYGKNFKSLTDVPNVSGWNTAKVENMTGLFNSYGFSSTELTVVPNVSGWNTAEVKKMGDVFNSYGRGSDTLKAVPDVSGWNTAKVTTMIRLFNDYGYSSTALDKVPNVSNWETGNVKKMNLLFCNYGYSSQKLNSVPDVSNWNTSEVTDMSFIFADYGHDSESLTAVPNVSNWNTSEVTNMQNMFNSYGYESTNLNFTLDFSKWDVGAVKTYDSMFFNGGAKATTWSVTIPATTGEQSNKKEQWYVGDGTNTGKCIAPASGREFTVAKQ